jgi:hypothetical protein
MISVISITIPLIIIYSISSALTQKYDYKIEHSNFLVVCSITLLLIIFGLIGILNIGFYLIIAFSVISLIYLIISKFDVKKLFSPSIVFYTIGIFIFAFLIRDIKLFWHDEISHWALATKSMYYSDNFYKGLQTMLTPTFNYFITKCSGFSTEHMYTGAWMLIWSCFLLPTGNLKWSNWKRVLVYLIATYFISGYIMKDVVFHIDELLGISGACLAAYWAIEERKGTKEYILATIGLIAISQIKDSYGAMISILISIFIIVNDVIKRDINKRKLIPVLSIIISPFIGYIISRLTLNKPEGYLSEIKFSKIPFVIATLHSKLYLMLLLLLLITIIAFIIFYLNNKKIVIFYKKIKIYKLVIITGIILLLLISYKSSMLFISGLSYDELLAFTNAWRDFFVSTSGGSTNIKTTAVSIILMGFISCYAIKKEHIKVNIARCFVLLGGIIIIGFAVLVSFSFGFDETGMYKNSVSWERYTSVPFILLVTFITSYLMLANNIYKENKHRTIAIALCLLLVVKYIPYPGAIMYTRYAKQRGIMSNISDMVKDDGDLLREHLDKDDTVFIASYISDYNQNECGNSRTKWLNYEISPIKSNWNYFKGYNDITGYDGSVEEYLNIIGKYDYYYIHSADMPFYEKFIKIFPNNKLYTSKALYKVVHTDKSIVLEPVYLDESKLLTIPSSQQ